LLITEAFVKNTVSNGRFGSSPQRRGHE